MIHSGLVSKTQDCLKRLVLQLERARKLQPPNYHLVVKREQSA